MIINSIQITPESKEYIFILKYKYSGHSRKMRIEKIDLLDFISANQGTSIEKAESFFREMMKHKEGRDKFFNTYLSWYHLELA